MIKERLNKLKKFFRKYRRLPTYEEMLTLFSVSSKNSVFKTISKLTDLGFIRKVGKTLSPSSKFFGIPVLGTVPAGFPIIADEDRKYLTLDEYLIDDPVTSFLFTVRGDSLIGEGIMDGDLVVVNKNVKPFPGDIVLAEIDHEWTLKILRRNSQKRSYYLEAANPKYPSFYPMQEMNIFGVVKAVIRRLRN
ncbi:MAG: S24 family peptidase [bacterium]